MEVFLWALDFLTMMLRVRKNGKKKQRRKKTQEQIALERVRAQKYQQITIYMMHEVNAHMMHALMH